MNGSGDVTITASSTMKGPPSTSACSGEDETDANLASLSADLSLGRVMLSPDATFSYPTVQWQLMVGYEHPRRVLERWERTAEVTANGEKDSSLINITSDLRDDDDDESLLSSSSLLVGSVRKQIIPFSNLATAQLRLAYEQQLQKKKAAEEEQQRSGSSTANGAAKKNSSNNKKKSPPILSLAMATQCIVDLPPRCSLYSKKVNAWSLYAKANRSYLRSAAKAHSLPSSASSSSSQMLPSPSSSLSSSPFSPSSYCIVSPTDSKVLPSVEAIASQYPHRFSWVPMAMAVEEALPLAPNGPFRGGGAKAAASTVQQHSTHGGADSNAALPHSPPQPIQLRALVPILDPFLDCGIERALVKMEVNAEGTEEAGMSNVTTAYNPILASVFSIIFEGTPGLAEEMMGLGSQDEVAASFALLSPSPSLPTILNLQSRVRDHVVTPLIVSCANRSPADMATDGGSEEEGAEVEYECMRLLRQSIIKVQPSPSHSQSPSLSGGEGAAADGADNLKGKKKKSRSLFLINKRLFSKACGWGHCVRWLGGIEKVVDGNLVRFI